MIQGLNDVFTSMRLKFLFLVPTYATRMIPAVYWFCLADLLSVILKAINYFGTYASQDLYKYCTVKGDNSPCSLWPSLQILQPDECVLQLRVCVSQPSMCHLNNNNDKRKTVKLVKSVLEKL